MITNHESDFYAHELLNLQRDAWRFQNAEAELDNLLANRLFLSWDKFGSSGRNSYSGPLSIKRVIPDLALCEISPWGDIQPSSVLSLEKTAGRLRGDTKYDVSQLNELESLLHLDRRPLVVSAWYEKNIHREILQRFGGQFLGLSSNVRDQLEDKFNFNHLLHEAGISTDNQLKYTTHESIDLVPSFESIRNLLGFPFVIQGQSKGGDGTFIINSKEDFAKSLTSLRGKIRISEFMDQQYSTVYILTVPHEEDCQVYIDLPSFKATYIPDLGISNVFGAGGDWTKSYPRFNVDQFIMNVTRIGKLAYKRFGMSGHWNLEGFMTDNNFYFNELNCRPGGGTEVSSVNQTLIGIPPFIVSHNILMLGGNVDYMPNEYDYNQQTLEEIQRRTKPGPFYLKVRSHDRSSLRGDVPGSGIYTFDGHSLQWNRPGLSTIEARFDKGEVLLANLPSSSTICESDVQLCTLEGIASIRHIFNGPHGLTDDGIGLTKAIYKLFDSAA